jgi:uncharacterized protein YecE (DUF72 family)
VNVVDDSLDAIDGVRRLGDFRALAGRRRVSGEGDHPIVDGDFDCEGLLRNALGDLRADVRLDRRVIERGRGLLVERSTCSEDQGRHENERDIGHFTGHNFYLLSPERESKGRTRLSDGRFCDARNLTSSTEEGSPTQSRSASLWPIPCAGQRDALRRPDWKSFIEALPRRQRYAFEFRDPSWLVPETNALLRKHNAAFCIYDIGGFHSAFDVTADFSYVRLHGPSAQKYQGSYDRKTLEGWAGWSAENAARLKAIYVYFDNDHEANAVRNALTLREMVGG